MFAHDYTEVMRSWQEVTEVMWGASVCHTSRRVTQVDPIAVRLVLITWLK